MQHSTPAARTGRPRSAAADAAILEATREALVELGWSKLTLGDVATRAGVAKTTLYRRWAGKNELVVDAVAELFDELELPDRGSLAADAALVWKIAYADPLTWQNVGLRVLGRIADV
ncbi:TetR/AcrR family transcriptional regulator, partial [Streptomyces sp. NPDC001215]